MSTKASIRTATKTYRVVKGVGYQSRRIKVGDFTTITLEEARHRAKNLLGPLASGIDPIKARHHPE
ncbi:integrase arm-type DNA-binding domain-containing protein [Candidatus Competibacter phosphatis]|uniref:integrase arm-type DNA-binding domain-containing protein n=1 Tax=Candidatus Competibacter phosphatis TaxID=221280 RepID=UPI001FE5AB00|nr:integrase arm-type DNA-binding domain-containing protein [Candidatus Competibacter phosphatis]